MAEDAIIADSKTNFSGGGIHCGYAASVTLTRVEFTSNEARSGGGLALVGTSQVVIEECQFHANAGIHGGGIYISALVGDQIMVNSCMIKDNFAGMDPFAAMTYCS